MGNSTSIFQKQVFVKPLWQSLFTAILTTFVFFCIDQSPYKSLSGFAVVISISISSININEGLYQKMKIMFYTLLVYSICILLGYTAGRSLWLIVPCFVLISWVFSFVKQHIPDLWGDINIPAGLAIYLAFRHPTLIDIEMMNLIAGVFVALIYMVFIGIYTTASQQQTKLVLKKQIPRLNAIGLSEKLMIYFIQLSILLCVGTFLYDFVLQYYPNYYHAYWLPFTMLIVLQVSHKLTLKRIKDRFLGTVIGCVLGSTVLVWHPPYVVMILILFVTMFAFIFFVRKDYKIAVFFVTIFVLILMGYHYKDTSMIVFERLAFTIAGGLLTLLSSVLVLRNKQF